MLKRYPEGVDKDFFYEKRCPSYSPDFIDTQKAGKAEISFCVINDLPSLVWVANLASLELHTLLCKKNPDQPAMVVFDLDPGAPANIIDCIPIALDMRNLFDEKGLKYFVKTSGGKGLHLYIPLNTKVTFDETKEFAKAVAQAFENHLPDKATSNMKKEERKGKVFIDWSQNDMNKSTVCVYSLRAREYPTVSTPVTWGELENAYKKRDAKLLQFQAKDVINRIEKHGDLFSGMLEIKQGL